MFQRNRTWRLIDCPPGANIMSSKWVFKHKINPDGTLERYKAHWVVRIFTQCAGVDFDETFTPVVKPVMIRTVLTIAASHRWSTKQLDVSNAFLHGHLKEHVLCQQPTGFVDAKHLSVVCLLDKSLYDMRQAPRVWFTASPPSLSHSASGRRGLTHHFSCCDMAATSSTSFCTSTTLFSLAPAPVYYNTSSTASVPNSPSKTWASSDSSWAST